MGELAVSFRQRLDSPVDGRLGGAAEQEYFVAQNVELQLYVAAAGIFFKCLMFLHDSIRSV